MTIANNLKNVKDDIAATARQCGRDPESIKLVAVSKKFPMEAIQEAISAGHTLFGENYIQEAQEKIDAIEPEATYHFIGHLQRNKAKIAARIFDVIETVDSFKLARALDKQLHDLGRTMQVLIQVNVGGDPNKAGVTPEDTERLLTEINELENLRVVGLMTMPPLTDTAEEARPFFKALRELSEELQSRKLFRNVDEVQLSMGMSGDYHVAIEEGATIIRIGTAIFGQRQY